MLDCAGVLWISESAHVPRETLTPHIRELLLRALPRLSLGQKPTPAQPSRGVDPDTVLSLPRLYLKLCLDMGDDELLGAGLARIRDLLGDTSTTVTTLAESQALFSLIDSVADATKDRDIAGLQDVCTAAILRWLTTVAGNPHCLTRAEFSLAMKIVSIGGQWELLSTRYVL